MPRLQPLQVERRLRHQVRPRYVPLAMVMILLLDLHLQQAMPALGVHQVHSELVHQGSLQRERRPWPLLAH